ncbi:MAG: RhuM family protein [Butyribacter sp.]|nr:RhuM family protein [Butyribacter sp.]
MEDWKNKLDAFLQFNDAEILKDKGKITAVIAKEFAESEFEKFLVIQNKEFMSNYDKYLLKLEKCESENDVLLLKTNKNYARIR